MYHLNKQTMPKSYPLWNKVENNNAALSGNKKSHHSWEANPDTLARRQPQSIAIAKVGQWRDRTAQLIMEHIYSTNIYRPQSSSLLGNAGLFSIPRGS